jgi:hypothetical protein
MTRTKTKAPDEAPKPRKKLTLKKATVRDLETRSGHRVKGGQYGPAPMSTRGATTGD